MVSKKKIGICLTAIFILALIVITLVGNSYETDLFWGLFAVLITIMFLCMAIGSYMLSVHFKETKPKLSKFLFGLGIYILICIVGAIAYSICSYYGVIRL